MLQLNLAIFNIEKGYTHYFIITKVTVVSKLDWLEIVILLLIRKFVAAFEEIHK